MKEKNIKIKSGTKIVNGEVTLPEQQVLTLDEKIENVKRNLQDVSNQLNFLTEQRLKLLGALEVLEGIKSEEVK